jgi:N-acetylmuramoyl-L-alanine amidase
VLSIHAKTGALLLGAVLLTATANISEAAEPVKLAYTRALGQEQVLRESVEKTTLAQIRSAIGSYERVVRRFPSSGYSDNALWQAANLALLAFERFHQPSDRQTGLRLLARLKQEYPSSSLVARVDDVMREFTALAASFGPSSMEPAVTPAPPMLAPLVERVAAVPSVDAASQLIALRAIKRTPLPDGMRVTIELDGESVYRSERLEGPRRVFFDLKNVRPIAALQDATLRFTDEDVKEIRLGRHPKNTTRVVMDMEGLDSYSVFTLYDPYRIVIDFQRSAAPVSAARPLLPVEQPVESEPASAPSVTAPPLAQVPLKLTPPALPSANSNGQFSIARQLGLGISRIVIDAGHGGHDPGARANGISEAELVLDVAQRLARLLEKHPGVEVVMTRDRDSFIALEERTAIANREGADLFLSIHANAARSARAHGVETYFLNFAPNAEAEAIAARENAGSTRTMHNLPEIVKAIALNNKINESRDFATMVQRSMVRRLAARNKQLKDLGVKQAPFVVLIGAGMPSVLAEISFVTHKQEAQLLKTGAYRQQIAEALQDAVLKYQQSLKKPRAVATR